MRLALARTAQWLMEEVPGGSAGRFGGLGAAGQEGAAGQAAQASYDGPDAWLAETDSRIGRLRYARSPVSFAGGPVDWARPPGPWGADPARWA